VAEIEKPNLHPAGAEIERPNLHPTGAEIQKANLHPKEIVLLSIYKFTKRIASSLSERTFILYLGIRLSVLSRFSLGVSCNSSMTNTEM
jgi:hypothetical protein